MTKSLVPFDPTTTQTDWAPTPDEGNFVIGRSNVQVVIVTWVDENGNKQYSQILRAEKGGGMTVLVDQDGRFGLATFERPVTKNQADWAAGWPEIDVSLLGLPSLEFPRGFPKVADPTAVDTALREAGEETGAHLSAIVSYEEIGQTVDNTTFSPHMTTVVYAVATRPRWARSRRTPTRASSRESSGTRGTRSTTSSRPARSSAASPRQVSRCTTHTCVRRQPLRWSPRRSSVSIVRGFAATRSTPSRCAEVLNKDMPTSLAGCLSQFHPYGC